MRRRIRTLLLIAGFVVLAVGALQVEATRAVWGATTDVVVARRDIDAGSALGADDLATRSVPAGLLPEGRITDPDEVVGSTSAVDLSTGEILLDRRLSEKALSATAAKLPDGHRAVAIPLDGSPLPLASGDHVDLLTAGAPWDGGGVVAGDVLVIERLDDAVVVAVAQAEAPALAMALGAGAVVPALRGPSR
jgi:Flp pilus assembly protein CpaB